jgi:hypothetical protein
LPQSNPAPRFIETQATIGLGEQKVCIFKLVVNMTTAMNDETESLRELAFG